MCTFAEHRCLEKKKGGGELVSEDIEKMLREISPPQ